MQENFVVMYVYWVRLGLDHRFLLGVRCSPFSISSYQVSLFGSAIRSSTENGVSSFNKRNDL